MRGKNGLQPGWRPPFGRVIADGVASADDAGRAARRTLGQLENVLENVPIAVPLHDDVVGSVAVQVRQALQ